MIHPTAIVEPGAQLGADVQIGPFAFVAATAQIGDGCILMPHAVVLDHSTLGARCRVHPGAVLGDFPQDLSFKNEPSFVVVGDDCTFREGVTVHRGTKPGSVTRIGNRVFMMANSHAAHNTEVGDHVVMANCALLGGACAVHQFCHVGRFAMVAASSMVTKDVPPFCTTLSSENSRVGSLNAVGLRRNGFDAARRAQIKQAFNLVYRSGLNKSQAVEKLRAETGNPFAAEFADFLAAAKRGICRPSFAASDDSADD